MLTCGYAYFVSTDNRCPFVAGDDDQRREDGDDFHGLPIAEFLPRISARKRRSPMPNWGLYLPPVVLDYDAASEQRGATLTTTMQQSRDSLLAGFLGPSMK